MSPGRGAGIEEALVQAALAVQHLASGTEAGDLCNHRSAARHGTAGAGSLFGWALKFGRNWFGVQFPSEASFLPIESSEHACPPVSYKPEA